MKTVKEWPSNERIDAIGTNGNDGLHYPTESECPLSPNFELAPQSLGDEEKIEKCLSDVAKLFGLKCGINCGWGNLTDEIEAKLKSTTCESVKPIYTQAMCDAGELANVGMECQSSLGVVTIKYVGKEVIVSEDGHGVESLTSRSCALDSFKPLTPPIKLEDGMAYQFDVRSSGRIVQAIYSKFDGRLYVSKNQWFDVASADYIKPLTVEGE